MPRYNRTTTLAYNLNRAWYKSSRVVPLSASWACGVCAALSCYIPLLSAATATAAEKPPTVQPLTVLNEPSANQTDAATPSLAEAPRNAQYLSKQQASALNLSVPQYCQGVWASPAMIDNAAHSSLSNNTSNATSNANIPVSKINSSNLLNLGSLNFDNNLNSDTVIEADYANYQIDQQAQLQGNVHISQDQQNLYADSINYNAVTSDVQASGKVSLQTPTNSVTGSNIDYNINSGLGTIKQAQFVDVNTQGNGSAGSISKLDPQITRIKDAQFSTCPPDNPAWSLHANTLTLNQATGRGITTNTFFKVKSVPVFYLPYFNFPIDDRRSSGLLTPSIGFNSTTNGLKLSQPLYLNLHPQVDATITPTWFTERNALLEGELRYLSATAGAGIMSGGYSRKDPLYNQLDRKQFDWQHSAQLTPTLSTELQWQYLSDKDYWYDLANSPVSTSTVYQQRFASITYNNPTGLYAQLKAQGYQLLDPTLSDAQKPYTRLPQLLVDWSKAYPSKQELTVVVDTHSDLGYFSKTLSDGNRTKDQGLRGYQQVTASLPLYNDAGFITPSLGVSGLGYRYRNASTPITTDNQALSQTAIIVVPQVSLDSGLTFDRYSTDGQRYLLEPRLLYRYAPYRSQNSLPNYDTLALNYQYDRLFANSRFIGNDRIDDNNTLSLGLSHSIIDVHGTERFKLSIGEQYYITPPKVGLTDAIANSEHSSGVAFSVLVRPVAGVSARIDQSFTPQFATSYTNASLQLNPSSLTQNRMLSWIATTEAAYIKRTQNTTANQEPNNVMRGSISTERIKNWAMVAYTQYDFEQKKFRDQLIGLDYKSCCWQLGLYSRRVYADVQDLSLETPKRQFYAELSLKGVAGLSSKVSSLLQQKIPAYTGQAE